MNCFGVEERCLATPLKLSARLCQFFKIKQEGMRLSYLRLGARASNFADGFWSKSFDQCRELVGLPGDNDKFKNCFD